MIKTARLQLIPGQQAAVDALTRTNGTVSVTIPILELANGPHLSFSVSSKDGRGFCASTMYAGGRSFNWAFIHGLPLVCLFMHSKRRSNSMHETDRRDMRAELCSIDYMHEIVDI